jgi:hypothetical protein
VAGSRVGVPRPGDPKLGIWGASPAATTHLARPKAGQAHVADRDCLSGPLGARRKPWCICRNGIEEQDFRHDWGQQECKSSGGMAVGPSGPRDQGVDPVDDGLLVPMRVRRVLPEMFRSPPRSPELRGRGERHLGSIERADIPAAQRSPSRTCGGSVTLDAWRPTACPPPGPQRSPMAPRH